MLFKPERNKYEMCAESTDKPVNKGDHSLVSLKQRKMLETITASEIAGYAVGALMLSATISAPKIDSFIASSQRSSLGMCKGCGDLKLIACSRCKGSGLIKEGRLFGLIPVVDWNPSMDGKVKSRSSRCSNCLAKGHLSCPECSKIP